MHVVIMRLTILLVTAVVTACASSSSSAPTPASGTSAAIEPRDLERRLNVIAHDSMMGRETGSEGLQDDRIHCV